MEPEDLSKPKREPEESEATPAETSPADLPKEDSIPQVDGMDDEDFPSVGRAPPPIVIMSDTLPDMRFLGSPAKDTPINREAIAHVANLLDHNVADTSDKFLAVVPEEASRHIVKKIGLDVNRLPHPGVRNVPVPEKYVEILNHPNAAPSYRSGFNVTGRRVMTLTVFF